MSIFIKNNITNKNAIINWRLDNGMGEKYSDTLVQYSSDFYEIGKAYLTNSNISIITILEYHNINNVSDVLIFAIMFNIYHGIELLLKSGIASILFLNDNNSDKSIGSVKKTHLLHGDRGLLNFFEKHIEDFGLEIDELFLISLRELIKDFKTKNVSPDFARYSFQINGDPQFYNQQDKNIDNVFVNLEYLSKVVSDILDKFCFIIEYIKNLCKNVNPKLDYKKIDFESNYNYIKDFSKQMDETFPENNNILKELMKI